MFRYGLLIFAVTILMTAICPAQQASSSDRVLDEEGITDGPAQSAPPTTTVEATSDSTNRIVGLLKLTFILVMFTNAVICGRWAIGTDRNFWGWYLFGLFTGPLAGGFMLHRCAADRDGKAPAGPLAALLGLGIPVAGWIIWMGLLG